MNEKEKAISIKYKQDEYTFYILKQISQNFECITIYFSVNTSRFFLNSFKLKLNKKSL
jgi:hypothetical protein